LKYNLVSLVAWKTLSIIFVLLGEFLFFLWHCHEVGWFLLVSRGGAFLTLYQIVGFSRWEQVSFKWLKANIHLFLSTLSAWIRIETQVFWILIEYVFFVGVQLLQK
jgi:hypothetical protein